MAETMREVAPGVWEPDPGLPFVDQIDIEVRTMESGWQWEAYRGARLLGVGAARTRWGLNWSVRRAYRRYRKQEGI